MKNGHAFVPVLRLLHPERFKYLSRIPYPLSLIPYHLSLITYHLSPITYHLSPITYHASLDLDVGILHDPRVFSALGADEGGEFLRRVADGIGAREGNFLLYIRLP